MLQPVRGAIKRAINTSSCSPITSKPSIFRSTSPGSANEGLSVPPNNPKHIKRRLFHIEQTVRMRGTQHALAHAHGFLSRRVPTRIRAEFMKQCVILFLDEGDWDAAFSIYWRMRGDQLTGRSEVLSQILDRSVDLPSTSTKVDQAIRDATNALETVGEAELRAILAHFIRTKADVLVSRHLVTRFQEKKGDQWSPGWKSYALLAQAESQAGYGAAAEDFFKKGRLEIGYMKQRDQLTWEQYHDCNQELYTHLFAGYAAFNQARPVLFNRLLLRMKRDGIAPSQRICNILIELQKCKRRGERAFSFYKAMRLSYPPIAPNATTFRLLFSALRSNERAEWKIDYNGRRLFQHMTQQHLYNTALRHNSEGALHYQTSIDSEVVNSDALNAALFLFMKNQDYAAATVTMRTFPVCSIPPTKNTRLFVVNLLMKRIKTELLENPSENVIIWSDRMLGEVIRLWDGVWRNDLQQKLLRVVQYFSRSMHEGIDIRMLLGLLRRAIICSADLWPGRDPVQENAVVNKAVAKANASMLPKRHNVTGWCTSPNYL